MLGDETAGLQNQSDHARGGKLTHPGGNPTYAITNVVEDCVSQGEF